MLPLAGRTALAPLLLLALTSPAHADAVDECIEASDEGQKVRNKGHWIEAQRQFRGCARAACPAPIRRDCSEWLTALEARLPSLVFRARDRKGNDLRDVRVWIDDKLVTEALDGRAIPVDPGERRLRMVRSDGASAELRVVVVEVEKARLIEVTLEASAPPASAASAAPPPPSSPPSPASAAARPATPALAYVLAGGALLGGAGFAFFGLRAQGEADEMRRTCAPACPASRVDAARRDALVANVSLGLGAVALGAALYLVLRSPPSEPPPAVVWLGPRGVGAGWTRSFLPPARAIERSTGWLSW